MYPILYIEAIRVKIRDGRVVATKAAHVVIGVDVEGIKQVLGIWIQQTEGAKFWHGVLTELRNRGCREALCDDVHTDYQRQKKGTVTSEKGAQDNRSPPYLHEIQPDKSNLDESNTENKYGRD